MPHFIIGTAGHVDHGKTTLIKALTDIDADRLPQEKIRGLTLDLGFAHIELPSGTVCGIVDVPGHERYLKNMLAGVGGFDLALLVIDAFEGIMAQTREHLEIIHMLDIPAGVVAITKTDRVEKLKVEELKSELSGFLKGTPLENAPLIPVSAREGEGLDELRSALDDVVKRLRPRDEEAPFRLPVDRVFTMPGFGTVVTGTVYQGVAAVDDSIVILPGPYRGKVRGIQVHGKDTTRCYAGQRAAINVARVDPEKISRGSQLVRSGFFAPTTELDVLMKVLPSSAKPLKNRNQVRLYMATSEAFGKIIILDADEIPPGESGYARISLETPVVAKAKDRFILRSPSALFTWGGGKILDPHPRFHRRFDKSVIEMLELKDSDAPMELAERIMDREPYNTYNAETLASAASIPLHLTGDLIRIMEKKGALYTLSPGKIVPQKVMKKLTGRVMDYLKKAQEKTPATLGLKSDEIRLNVPKMEDRLFRELLIFLKKEEKIKEKSGLISTKDHRPQLPAQQEKSREWVLNQFRKGGFAPPTKQDLMEKSRLDKKQTKELIDHMVFNGELVDLDGKILFTPRQINDAKLMLGGFILEKGSLSPSDARRLLNTTRKYVIPLLEYLDRIYFTRRQKEGRVLVKQNVLSG